MQRPSNDTYFLNIARAVSLRGTCRRRQVGAVFTDENHRIISTGYNSVASKLPHCYDHPCPGGFDKSGDTSRCIARHAETIALSKCNDIYSIRTAYVTASPCIDCTRALLDTSCQRIVFSSLYPHPESQIIWESYNRKWCHHELC